MKHPDERLITPLYVKTDGGDPLPDHEPVYYVLGRNGLSLCRNHPFFSSSVPARHAPSELLRQERSLELRFPRLPRTQIELIVGFFSRIAVLHGSEAAVLLLWDRDRGRIRFHVPRQRAKVSEGWSGRRYAIDVHYDAPTDLGSHVNIVGTVHSHVDGPAYASWTDKHDEEYLTGLHVVVGRINSEPPEFHCEFVVDGERFPVEPREVIDAYGRRRAHVPEDWIRRVEVHVDRPSDGAWYREGA